MALIRRFSSFSTELTVLWSCTVDHLLFTNLIVKKYEIWFTFAEVIVKIKVVHFFETQCRSTADAPSRPVVTPSKRNLLNHDCTLVYKLLYKPLAKAMTKGHFRPPPQRRNPLIRWLPGPMELTRSPVPGSMELTLSPVQGPWGGRSVMHIFVEPDPMGCR